MNFINFVKLKSIEQKKKVNNTLTLTGMWVTDLVLQFDCHDSQPTLGILHVVRYKQSKTIYIDDLTKFTDKISSQSNGELASSSDNRDQVECWRKENLKIEWCMVVNG